MDDLLIEFLEETQEQLEQLETSVLRLEHHPRDKEVIDTVFRLMHTLKGNSGFFDLPHFESLTHHAEDVLAGFRDGRVDVTMKQIVLILETIDHLQELTDVIEETGAEPEDLDKSLIERLRSVSSTSLIEAGDTQPNIVDTSDITEDEQQEVPSGSDAEETETADTEPVIRVPGDVLDALTKIVDDIESARTLILKAFHSRDDDPLVAPLARLDRGIADLREAVANTTTQSVQHAWSKLPKLVSKLARELDKDIDITITCHDLKMDRCALKPLTDSLVHMIRNAIDHGIEPSAVRVKTGKAENGTILLNATQEDDRFIITLSDDGQGICIDSLTQHIVSRGLASRESLEAMSEQAIYDFIFKAGFSTADAVSKISGRGVGMDVVRTNIETLGGSIELTSIVGKGTCFTISLPSPLVTHHS